MIYPKTYDVIVVDGDHADTEAALVVARMGAQTLLLTRNIETPDQMSCNPSINGIGEGHSVCELDTLGGVIALATGKSGTQSRRLSASKGVVVRATHVQTGCILYKTAAHEMLENQRNFDLLQQSVDDVTLDGGHINGVITTVGVEFRTRAVVLTAGTFLSGKIYIGLEDYEGGRTRDLAAKSPSGRLRELNLPQGRLKTGTSPCIDGHTIDSSQLTEQPGGTLMPALSVRDNAEIHPCQVSCWIAHTNLRTHDVIRNGFDRNPMFTGKIEGVGPCYCSSIESKINRFIAENSHQVFLEPEDLTINEYYLNGTSTSLPFDIQIAFVRSVKDLENTHVLRPGYTIEYDYFDPRNLKASLETKTVRGPFFTGQISGATGYKEAVTQGLLTDTNAVQYTRRQGPSPLHREQAYLGVLVGGLITKGANEPYRMLTSRAEYRLRLRKDDTDTRLTEGGHKVGLVGGEQWRMFNGKREAVEREIQHLKITWYTPQELVEDEQIRVFGQKLSHEVNLHDLLRCPNLGYTALMALEGAGSSENLSAGVIEQVEIQVRYQGYIDRQNEEIDSRRDVGTLKLSDGTDYSRVKGLSAEVQQKFSQHEPEAVRQASHIFGVTSAAVILLMVYLKRGFKRTK